LLWTELVVEVDVTRRHLQEQVSLYGDLSLVNLVDQEGYEKPIKEAYERYVAKVNVPSFVFADILLIRFRQTYLKSSTSTSTSTTSANICVGTVSAS
jgi:hypothetical protein